MKKLLLSIDPGLSTGIALLAYDEETVELEGSWQFPGGANGLNRWISTYYDALRPDTTIAEKFTARATKGFSYTTASLEPLRCEGVLLATGVMPDYPNFSPVWRDPSQQYVFGGEGKADKKKRQHAALKALGYYVTGKTLGTADADDVRSAIAHGIAYLIKEKKHRHLFDRLRGVTG